MKATHCLGFAFEGNAVVLIEKKKPEFQAGKLNGLGGKVEETDEDSRAAMVREFREECGVNTHPHAWVKFATMTFEASDAIVDCFTCVLPHSACIRTTTEERVSYYEIADALKGHIPPAMNNIPILVSMAKFALDGNAVHYGLHERAN